MYSFEQVIHELRYAIALKTLKNWANRIEVVTDKRFDRRVTRNVAGRPYSYKVFSFEEIEGFKEIIRLRDKKMPLKEAMMEVFMSPEEKMNREMIHLSKKEFEENKATIKELLDYVKVIVQENAQLEQRVRNLETKMVK